MAASAAAPPPAAAPAARRSAPALASPEPSSSPDSSALKDDDSCHEPARRWRRVRSVPRRWRRVRSVPRRRRCVRSVPRRRRRVRSVRGAAGRRVRHARSPKEREGSFCVGFSQPLHPALSGLVCDLNQTCAAESEGEGWLSPPLPTVAPTRVPTVHSPQPQRHAPCRPFPTARRRARRGAP